MFENSEKASWCVNQNPEKSLPERDEGQGREGRKKTQAGQSAELYILGAEYDRLHRNLGSNHRVHGKLMAQDLIWTPESRTGYRVSIV